MIFPTIAVILATSTMSPPLGGDSATIEVVADQSIEIRDASFYSRMRKADGHMLSTETHDIPHVVESSCYEWTITFKRKEGVAKLTEILLLPAPADEWVINGRKDRSMVNAEQTQATYIHDVDLDQGTAESRWCITKGDPVGDYSITLKQNEKILHRFEFRVGDLI